MDNIFPDIPSKLKEIKFKFDKNDRELADIAQLTTTNINTLINGRIKNPSLFPLLRIADHFNISIEWFFLDKGSMLKEGQRPSPDINSPSQDDKERFWQEAHQSLLEENKMILEQNDRLTRLVKDLTDQLTNRLPGEP